MHQLSYTLATWDVRDSRTIGPIVSVLRQVFHTHSQGEDWFIWKHYRNPWGPSIVTYAVHDETDEVVAVRAFWRWQLLCRSRVYRAFQPCDTATLPAHQRRGLFTQLTLRAVDHAATDGAAFLFNFPNRSSAPGYLRLGWQPEGRLLTLCRPARLGRSALALLRWIRGSRTPFTPTAPRAPSASRSDFAHFAALKGPEPEGFAGVRTAESLAWRFGEHPAYIYAVALGDSCGFVYRAGQQLGMRVLSVEDLRCRGDWSNLQLLLHDTARHEDADVLTVVLSEGHPAVGQLRRSGFLRAPTNGRLVVRSLLTQSAGSSPCDTWALTGCDIDTH